MLEERTAMGFSLSYQHSQRGELKSLTGALHTRKVALLEPPAAGAGAAAAADIFENNLAVPGILKVKKRC